MEAHFLHSLPIATVLAPSVPQVPMLISVPHCGTAIPEDIGRRLDPDLRQGLPDTDWFVHRLYEFAPKLGATLLHANYSRFVVDLNRPRDAKPLYSDGRRETGLVPTCSFAGTPLYVDSGPTQAEVAERLQRYYDPYHDRLRKEIDYLRSTFGQVLLLEGHSIRHLVPSIRPTAFPQLILGDQDGRTASAEFSQTALKVLHSCGYQVAHNDPFKGGHITRHYGQPERGVHALQLEMCQNLYLDESKPVWDQARAQRLQDVLQHLLQALITTLDAS